jgi:hypothetical protein
MPPTIDGLQDPSSSRSRHSRRESRSYREKSCQQWNIRDARVAMEQALSGISPVALGNLQSRSYTPSQQELEFLNGLFGQPSCTSPWKWKGIGFIFFLIIFFIIIAAIFCCGPEFFGAGSWVLWLFILFLVIILILGGLYSSTKIEQTGATCQI